MQEQANKGYKVTDQNGKCRGFQFEVGKRYTHEGKIEICSSGFHYCQLPQHCFNYYEFDPNNRVFEVVARGPEQTENDKSCTADIEFIREIPWEEVLKIVNIGIDNTGHSNSGDWNSGNRNSGNSNSGDWNSGDRNSGDRNSGDWNSGNRNSGYSNSGDRNSGAFCTGSAPFPMFNKPSDWTEQDFINSRAYSLLCQVDTTQWIPLSHMSEEEKEKYPSYKTAEGYIKDIPFREAFQNKWHNWDEESRNEFKALPNFDAAIFEEITGVKI